MAWKNVSYLEVSHLSIPELSSLTNVDIAFVTESAATNKSFLNDLPTDPGVPFPLLLPAISSLNLDAVIYLSNFAVTYQC